MSIPLLTGWVADAHALTQVSDGSQPPMTLNLSLSDAGGPARPNWQLTWPARVRCSDFVLRSFS